MVRTRSGVKQEPPEETATTLPPSCHFNAVLPTRDSGPNAAASPDTIMQDEHQPTVQIPQSDAMTVDDAMVSLGHCVKELMQAIEQVRELVTEDIQHELPQVVIVGDQNAGKSSVIEALCDIKVPRSSGTCTRCPLQITTSSSVGPWKCRVSLVKKYSFYDNIFQDAHGNLLPYGPWQKDMFPQTTVIATTENPTDLEDILRRAQLAILNPGDDPLKYVCASVPVEELSHRVEFSPNIVRIDIESPDLANLAFVDLPGVISQTEDGTKRYLVTLVRTLVENYLRDKASLILLACAMEGDIANSITSSMLHDIPGAMDRCIAVLTKPDRLPEGDSDKLWKDILGILRGERYRVGHGYFVTKQPSQKQLDDGITYREARVEEVEYFARQAPWSTPSFVGYAERCGTEKLRTYLSQQLAFKIHESLPGIFSLLNERLLTLGNELEQYPDPPENAQGQILDALNHYTTLVKQNVDGEDGGDFHDDIRKLIENFRSEIGRLRPRLAMNTPATPAKPVSSKPTRSKPAPSKPTTSTPSSKPGKRTVSEVIQLSSGDEGTESTPCPTPSSKRPKLESDVQTPSSITSARFQNSLSGSAVRTLFKIPGKWTLGELRAVLQRGSSLSVRNETSTRAIDQLRLQSVQQWDKAMETFLNRMAGLVNAKLQELLEGACGQWVGTEFYGRVQRLVDAFLSLCIEEQRKASRRLFDLESKLKRPWAISEDAITESCTKEFARLMDERFERRANEHLDKIEAKTGKETEGSDRENKLENSKVRNEIRKELGPDLYQAEVDVMGKVCGYYVVASSRFVDHVVQGVLVELFGGCRDGLAAYLKGGLEVEGDDARDHCTRLLAEDPRREVRRSELKEERDNIVQAQEKLASLTDPQE